MKINLISRNNGVGLSTDVELLHAFLFELGHEPVFIDLDADEPREANVNIFIEVFDDRHNQSRYRIGVFNPEWFEHAWIPQVRNFDQIWAKSKAGARYFESLMIGRNPVRHTGFMSRDMRFRGVEAARLAHRGVFHLRGRSSAKGTQAVLDAWRLYGAELPPLTIVSATEIESVDLMSNVTIRVGSIRRDELAMLMSSHPIHLCPSEVEGWGHYITEALSVGAYTITTYAEPMKDHTAGLYMDQLWADPGEWRAARGYYPMIVKPRTIADAVRRAAELSDQELKIYSQLARTRWQDINARGRLNILRALDDLQRSPRR